MKEPTLKPSKIQHRKIKTERGKKEYDNYFIKVPTEIAVKFAQTLLMAEETPDGILFYPVEVAAVKKTIYKRVK